MNESGKRFGNDSRGELLVWRRWRLQPPVRLLKGRLRPLLKQSDRLCPIRLTLVSLTVLPATTITPNQARILCKKK
jgi:hypothetical protein